MYLMRSGLHIFQVNRLTLNLRHATPLPARTVDSCIFPRAQSVDKIVDTISNMVHQPVHRYEWNDEHTKVFRNGGHLEENWLPEFLDLILVAAMLKLGDG